MALNEAIDLFLTECAQKGISLQTIYDYRNWLSTFAGYVGPRQVGEISAQDIEAFEAALRRYQPSFKEGGRFPTVVNHIQAIRRLYQWLVERGFLHPRHVVQLGEFEVMQVDAEVNRTLEKPQIIAGSPGVVVNTAAKLLIEWLAGTESSGGDFR